MAELRVVQLETTDDGRFVGQRLEIRNDKSGCKVSGRRVTAWVKYEFRKHQTAECLTREQAETALSIPVDSEWTNRVERYEYQDGDWTLVPEPIEGAD